MTPNKIYINVTPLGVDYSIVPIPDFGGVEYIRKDALLEWANARKSGLSSGESFVAGERKMLKEIIDKLNSM